MDAETSDQTGGSKVDPSQAKLLTSEHQGPSRSSSEDRKDSIKAESIKAEPIEAPSNVGLYHASEEPVDGEVMEDDDREEAKEELLSLIEKKNAIDIMARAGPLNAHKKMRRERFTQDITKLEKMLGIKGGIEIPQNDEQKRDEPEFHGCYGDEMADIKTILEGMPAETAKNCAKVKPVQQEVQCAREYWERQYKALQTQYKRLCSLKSKRKHQETQDEQETQAGRPKKRTKTSEKDSKKQQNLEAAAAQLGNMLTPNPDTAARVTRSSKKAQTRCGALAKAPGISKEEKWKQIFLGYSTKDKKIDQELITIASQSFGFGKCVLQEDGTWMLPNLTRSLKDHQLVGVRWMLSREFSPNGPRGGILADEMGLGKTYQMLATISQNCSGDDVKFMSRKNAGGTLIVAPAAAIDHWKQEIESHTPFTVIHYSSKVFGKFVSFDYLRKANIVLASYDQVEINCAANEKKALETRERISKNPTSIPSKDDGTGILFKIMWHRVVLDEAHSIKNSSRKTSKACVGLAGKNRWCLTGTPVLNSIEELFPYFQFIEADWVPATVAEFKSQYCNLDNIWTEKRLSAIMPSIMLRRERDQGTIAMAGEMPTETQVVDLFPDERIIYDFCAGRYEKNPAGRHGVEKIESNGTKRVPLAVATRLRRCAAHPYLVETEIQKLQPWEKKAMKKMLKETKGKQRQFLLEVLIKGGTDGADEEESAPDEDEAETQKTDENVKCLHCSNFPEVKTTTKCNHIYCSECIVNLIDTANQMNHPFLCIADGCGRVVADGDFTVDDENTGKFQPGEETVAKMEKLVEEASNTRVQGNVRGGGRRLRGKRRIGDDVNGVQPRLVTKSTFLEEYDKNFKGGIPTSAKTVAAFKQIKKWQDEAPDDKIIVFARWKSLFCILGRVLELNSIPFLYYCGDMTMEQRDQARIDFANKPHIKVLVASLQCAGVAINLVCANRSILLDPWFNNMEEKQALSRVTRIGQEKVTHSVRIIARDTYDEVLEEMQNRKHEVVSKVLKSGEKENDTIDPKEIQKMFRYG